MSKIWTMTAANQVLIFFQHDSSGPDISHRNFVGADRLEVFHILRLRDCIDPLPAFSCRSPPAFSGSAYFQYDGTPPRRHRESSRCLPQNRCGLAALERGRFVEKRAASRIGTSPAVMSLPAPEEKQLEAFQMFKQQTFFKI
mmetsp:Transcript_15990/g.31856  ORF Transcript_15990/g.31856 Transcript_15990/m.31856 type:complete len:142 (+) Transcript_15990:1432-1857(+)